jgi:hypothetical protein
MAGSGSAWVYAGTGTDALHTGRPARRLFNNEGGWNYQVEDR